MVSARLKSHVVAGLVAVFLAGSLEPARSAFGGEDLDTRRFLDTYRLALGRLQAACDSGEIEGVYTSRWFKAGADRAVREASLDMAYASDGRLEKHVLIRRDLGSTPYFERVFLPRSGQTLILERLNPARPFFIRWISKPSEAPDTLSPTDRRDTIARAAYSIGGGFLIPSILESRSFRVTELGSVDREGTSLVRVAFESRPDEAKSSPGLYGWLLLDPELDWAVRAHEVRIVWPASMNSPSIVSGTVRYPNATGAAPFPEEVTLVTRFGHDVRSEEHRIHFQAKRRSAKPPPADAFTLAAYGLGDYSREFQERPEDRGVGHLVVDPPVVPFEPAEPKTSVDISFQMTNSGLTPVRVVGMRMGCAAILPDEDLPSHISPGQTKRFTLKLQAFPEPEAGESRTPLYLYTTAPGQAEVELTLVGRKKSPTTPETSRSSAR